MNESDKYDLSCPVISIIKQFASWQETINTNDANTVDSTVLPRMAMLPSSLLLLIFTFSTFINAEFTVPTGASSLIPSCAQICFESFVINNWPSVCSDTPSLDCLCENESASSYTIGEGAVQCIMSEASIGFCKGDDSSNETVLKAYDMCSSDKQALPNTHSTLTATLVLQSGSASIVQIAPVSTTKASGSKTSSTAPATTSATSTTAASSTTGSPSAAAATSYNTSPEKKNEALSTAQIAGIVVAGVGGSALALGLILLFACYRRRRREKRDSGYLPFQEEPSISIKSQSHFGISKPVDPSPASMRPLTPTGPFLGGRMPPRVPPRGEAPSPNPFSQRNVIPDNIGLAMTSESPDRNLLTPHGYNIEEFRGPSPLLPERPVLTLQVPIRPNSHVEAPYQQQQQQQQQQTSTLPMNRQSLDTQFEDDDSCSTAVASETPWNAATYSYNPSEKVLEVGSGNLQTMRPIQHPNPTYYQPPRVEDEHSPNNETHSIIDSYKNSSTEPDFYIRPLNLSQNFSQPRRPENAANPQVAREMSVKYPATATSSVYSTATHVQRPPSAEIDRLNSLMQTNPSFRRVMRKSGYNPTGPYDQTRTSVGSMTSFETVDSINAEPQELPDNNLSPVVESPSSDYGHSSVNYPKIKNSARQSRGPNALSSLPQPPPPAVTSPPRPGTAHSNKPWQEAEIASQKERMTYLGLQPPPGPLIRKSEDFFRSSLAKQAPPPPPPMPLPLPPIKFNTQSPAALLLSSKRRSPAPPPLALPSESNQSQPSQNQNQNGSKWKLLQRSGSSASSNNNSYNNTGTNGTTNTTESEDTTALKSPYWRPQILNNLLRKDSVSKAQAQTHAQAQARSQPQPQSQDQQYQAQDINKYVYQHENGTEQIVYIANGELPKTPGWVPKLTPTRRGNDMFLSVQ
ncbi:hypothetical protein CJF31_00005391 [Rutstroemia sp. NJR-2017a BVV2]|nr:hypothetical protein CJF31_00005391 [Rutstroemia sp. NJR-2017a BVV2]